MQVTNKGSRIRIIKGNSGEVIANKTTELSAICDHLNLQIDNPLSIMTQVNGQYFETRAQVLTSENLGRLPTIPRQHQPFTAL